MFWHLSHGCVVTAKLGTVIAALINFSFASDASKGIFFTPAKTFFFHCLANAVVKCSIMMSSCVLGGIHWPFLPTWQQASSFFLAEPT